MPQQIFQSQYPILEACMNRGSTLPLAIAVHRAGAYPSLCSWTYGGNYQMLQRDLDQFVKITGSNRIQISFEIEGLPSPEICHRIINSHNVPTVEIIYGQSSSTVLSPEKLDQHILDTVGPLHQQGVKIFKRSIEPVSAEETTRYHIDGFCVKGTEAGGYTSNTMTVLELFRAQQKLTPAAYLIPYGGIGTAAQVRQYIDLGAEMVGVGTVFALSAEGLVKDATKLAAIKASKNDLSEFTFNDRPGKQNALKFDAYDEPDDSNHTAGLKKALFDKKSTQGHIFTGYAIEHVNEILPCQQIVQNLIADL